MRLNRHGLLGKVLALKSHPVFNSSLDPESGSIISSLGNIGGSAFTPMRWLPLRRLKQRSRPKSQTVHAGA